MMLAVRAACLVISPHSRIFFCLGSCQVERVFALNGHSVCEDPRFVTARIVSLRHSIALPVQIDLHVCDFGICLYLASQSLLLTLFKHHTGDVVVVVSAIYPCEWKTSWLSLVRMKLELLGLLRNQVTCDDSLSDFDLP